MEKILNIFGLLIGLIGTFIMYNFTPKTNSQVVLYRREEMEKIRRKDQFKNKVVRLGMFLLFISFLCQATALLCK